MKNPQQLLEETGFTFRVRKVHNCPLLVGLVNLETLVKLWGKPTSKYLHFIHWVVQDKLYTYNLDTGELAFRK